MLSTAQSPLGRLPKVSVVIPCHNSGQWLGAAIQSALDQSEIELEILVVLDNSNDNSRAVAEFYGAAVRVLAGDWRNGNAARNHGLATATGEWIQFLDADDFLQPGKIASQMIVCHEELDVIYSGLLVREERSGRESITCPTPGSGAIEQWLRWELCQTGAALWNADALRSIGGWKEGLACCQDNELTMRALMRGLRFRYLEGPSAGYRIWSEETVCRRDPRRVVTQKAELIDQFVAWLKESGFLRDHHLEIAGQACFELSRTLARVSIPEAAGYARARMEAGLFRMEGPAAPTRFVQMARLLGYKNAEYLARWLRGFTSGQSL